MIIFSLLSSVPDCPMSVPAAACEARGPADLHSAFKIFGIFSFHSVSEASPNFHQRENLNWLWARVSHGNCSKEPWCEYCSWDCGIIQTRGRSLLINQPSFMLGIISSPNFIVCSVIFLETWVYSTLHPSFYTGSSEGQANRAGRNLWRSWPEV